eukprot:7391156-Prymnesium_polylepis.3
MVGVRLAVRQVVELISGGVLIRVGNLAKVVEDSNEGIGVVAQFRKMLFAAGVFDNKSDEPADQQRVPNDDDLHDCVRAGNQHSGQLTQDGQHENARVMHKVSRRQSEEDLNEKEPDG